MTHGPCPAAWTASSHWRDRSSLDLEVGMRPSRRILGSLVLAPVLAIALAANTLASGPYTYTLSGFETSLTKAQSCGDVSTFAGVARTADDSGTWKASICHPPLATTSPWITSITGGTFSYAGTVRSVAGVFSGGSLTQTSGFDGCANQTYSVSSTLDVGSVTAILTHYRTKLFGRWCIVYAATVTGTADLTFP